VDPCRSISARAAAFVGLGAEHQQSRSVITNGQGRYEIVDLRPGTYSLTFMAPGFKTIKRDNIELP
jgi:hypothetical protein